MRWKLLLGALLLAVASVSCSKRGGGSDEAAPDPVVPDGWELVSWVGNAEIAGRIYLQLADGRFTLYQQVGSLTTAGYKVYDGTYAFTTDPEQGTLLSGTYSDGEPWRWTYRVETMTETELLLFALGEEVESLYRRTVIPDHVKEPSVEIASRSAGLEPFL